MEQKKNKGGRPPGPNYQKNLLKRQKSNSIKVAYNRQAFIDQIQKESRQQIMALAKGFLNSVDREDFAGKYMRYPVLHDREIQFQNDGIMLRPIYRISYDDLRAVSYGNSLIGAIHKIRVDDLTRFSQTIVRRSGDNREGFTWIHEDGETELPIEEVREANKFFELMGDKVDGWSSRDRFGTVFEMMLRDTLSIDTICLYLVKNSFGNLIEMQYLDPATIFPVDPKTGFRGDKSIGWVQIVNQNIVETFAKDEIIWKHQNHISDVHMRGFGISPTEISILELVGMINALKFNRDRFNSRNPPPGIISLDGDISQETLDDIQLQYANLFSGNFNNYRIPVIATPSGKLTYTPLNIQNDLQFDKLLQWLSSLVLAAHGMDQAELGMKLQASQALSEASPDARIAHASSRAKKAMLSFFSDVFNEVKEFHPSFANKKQVFINIDPADIERDFNKRQAAVKTYMTIDEIRIQEGLKPLGEVYAEMYELDEEKAKIVKRLGGTILDAQFTQYANSILQALDEGGDDGMGEGEEFDDEDDYIDQDNQEEDKNWDDFDWDEDNDLNLESEELSEESEEL
jgi:hypothetical protein